MAVGTSLLLARGLLGAVALLEMSEARSRQAPRRPPRSRNPGVQVFYRVALHDPPERSDFELRQGEAGVSVFNTIAQAASLARWRQRRFGLDPQYIARVEIEEATPIAVVRTGTRGHHELIGPAEEIFRRCTGTVRRV